MRKLTPKQRRVLRELPKNYGQFWKTMLALGHSRATAHKWLRQPDFCRARELFDQRSLDEIGISHAYVLSKTKEVVERCMDPADFRDTGALKGLELLGRRNKTWGDDAAKYQAPAGPGLTVIVQAGGVAVGVQTTEDETRVAVNLPGPER